MRGGVDDDVALTGDEVDLGAAGGDAAFGGGAA